MKIATLEQIGKSLDITKQAVSKLYIKPGFIIKNEKGQVDIEEPQNRKFLKSKHADFSVFYPKKGQQTPKNNQKASKKDMQSSKETPKAKKEEEETTEKSQEQPIQDLHQLEVATRLEKYRSIKKDNALKDLRLEEEKGRLIDKSLVQNIVFDTLGIISREIQSVPYSIVDEVISICAATPDIAREKIIKLLIKNYAIGIRNAVDESKKIFKNKGEK